MNNPRVHAELIKAWADGSTIEVLMLASGWTEVCHPSWSPNTAYRVKPKEKVKKYRYAYHRANWNRENYAVSGYVRSWDDLVKQDQVGLHVEYQIDNGERLDWTMIEEYES